MTFRLAFLSLLTFLCLPLLILMAWVALLFLPAIIIVFSGVYLFCLTGCHLSVKRSYTKKRINLYYDIADNRMKYILTY